MTNSDMTLEPFLLSPVLDERPWGGRKLADYGKDLPPGVPIGESWEVADLAPAVAPTINDPNSRVATGPYAGSTLREVIALDRNALLGPVEPTEDGRFPLLFKLLDAKETLSVQVHPPASYVNEHPETRFKTESWFVVDAQEGSVLYLDLAQGVRTVDVAEAFDSNAVVDLLATVPAIPGSFHHLPAGLVHAMGAGVIVAEVQTPSDTTFRIYDWSTEYERAPREIHREEALASIVVHPETISSGPMAGDGGRTLIESPHYWIREHRGATDSVSIGHEPGPRVVSVIDGSATIGDLVMRKGTTAIVPACAVSHTTPTTTSDAHLLVVGVPVKRAMT